MILILCDTFEDAKNAFAWFMDFLETYEPLSIRQVYEFSYCVETDADLRYLFTDYRMAPFLRKIDDVDEIEMCEFFDDMVSYYYNTLNI